MALTTQDLKQVSTIVVDSINTAFEQLFVPKFDEIDNRFEAIDTQFAVIDNRFVGLEIRLGGLESKLGGLEGRVGTLEIAMRDLRHEVTQNSSEVICLRADIRELYDLTI